MQAELGRQSTAVNSATENERPPAGAITTYDEFEDDQSVLRQTIRLNSTSAPTGTIDASSGEACQAAYRIFGRVSFLFKKRDDILKLFGDPSTISDYNEKASDDPNKPLVYTFFRRASWMQIHD